MSPDEARRFAREGAVRIDDPTPTKPSRPQPTPRKAPSPRGDVLEEEWEVQWTLDEHGSEVPYFVNLTTGEAQWEDPREPEAPQPQNWDGMFGAS